MGIPWLTTLPSPLAVGPHKPENFLVDSPHPFYKHGDFLVDHPPPTPGRHVIKAGFPENGISQRALGETQMKASLEETHVRGEKTSTLGEIL